MNALQQIPEVMETSGSTMVTSIGSYWGEQIKYNNAHDSANAFCDGIDEHYLPLHGHHLMAGRNFTPKSDSAVESEVIVNEQVLKRFKIADGDAKAAIGETLDLGGKPVQIIGVVRRFPLRKSR